MIRRLEEHLPLGHYAVVPGQIIARKVRGAGPVIELLSLQFPGKPEVRPDIDSDRVLEAPGAATVLIAHPILADRITDVDITPGLSIAIHAGDAEGELIVEGKLRPVVVTIRPVTPKNIPGAVEG